MSRTCSGAAISGVLAAAWAFLLLALKSVSGPAGGTHCAGELVSIWNDDLHCLHQPTASILEMLAWLRIVRFCKKGSADI